MDEQCRKVSKGRRIEIINKNEHIRNIVYDKLIMHYYIRCVEGNINPR